MRSRFQFVDDHQSTYEVKRLCQVLDVNRSSYYKWLAGAEARATRQREDRILAEEIREVHDEPGGAYGSPLPRWQSLRGGLAKKRGGGSDQGVGRMSEFHVPCPP
ncbi:hypothetical protein OOK36_48340 [Streptomyces sp. NBC_00365]|uniref:hypothetical protein n=1 Tax=Streptomyces sp. NBC_00365 TaxID=2975726 RepID=UPI00224D627C|nr:hypothetical protein [Streptomyces sp. NBC_00365]MCX5096424.1 hypothetical protein [Streptomyces sp. NBC_00365]